MCIYVVRLLSCDTVLSFTVTDENKKCTYLLLHKIILLLYCVDDSLRRPTLLGSNILNSETKQISENIINNRPYSADGRIKQVYFDYNIKNKQRNL